MVGNFLYYHGCGVCCVFSNMEEPLEVFFAEDFDVLFVIKIQIIGGFYHIGSYKKKYNHNYE